MTPTVVFDCMIFLQAATNPTGHSGQCLRAVQDGTVILAMSQTTRYEVHDVLTRPGLRAKLPSLTDDRVTEICDLLDYFALQVSPVPAVFHHSRDPKDEKYLNLAVAASASVIVSRDNDLLDLMKPENPDGTAFRAAHPTISILDPAAFLATLTGQP